MVFIKKNAAELQTQEIEIHKALKSWYMTPGIPRELRKSKTEAVQVVLEVLERRRGAETHSRLSVVGHDADDDAPEHRGG